MNAESHQLINRLPCGYIITAKDGIITYANQFILDIFQFEADDVIDKKHLHEFLPFGVKVYYETYLQPTLIREGKLNGVSLEILQKDGSLISMMVNANCLNEDCNEASSFHYTLFDATQNKKSESDLLFATQLQNRFIAKLKLSNDNYALLTQELEENKNFYKKQSEIFDQVSAVGRVGGWDLNLITGEIFLSKVTREIHGFSKNTALDFFMEFSFLKEGLNKNIAIKSILNCIKYGKKFDVEVVILKPQDSSESWVRLQGCAETSSDLVTINSLFSSLVDENEPEQSIRIFGTCHDIDRQKKLMLRLQQYNTNIIKDNTYLKSIVENKSFYIVKTDLMGHYTYFNPYFIEKFGINATDWMGKHALGLIHPEDHQNCKDIVKKCFQEPYKSHWTILRNNTMNETITNQWEFSLLRDDSNNLSEFLSIGYDITPLVQKQDELISLLDITYIQNTRLQNFTHIISHNIRSHVANLKGIISITDLEKFEDRKMAWELIEKTVGSLDETIHHLSEIISIQSQKQLPMVEINVFTEINRIAQGINVSIANTKTQIFYDFNKRINLVTNTAYFESIFLNLIVNCIKYKSSDKNPEIHISYHQKDKYKVICIKDNGLGINLKRYGDKLFGMYKTFHGNKDAKGLGLFIIKTQIEALGGKIEVESIEGEGTAFNVYFLEE